MQYKQPFKLPMQSYVLPTIGIAKLTHAMLLYQKSNLLIKLSQYSGMQLVVCAVEVMS